MLDHLTIREGNLGANRSGQAVTHRAEAAAGDELARVFVFVPLAGRHLMLAHAGRDDGIALGRFVDRFDHHLLEDHLIFLTFHVILHVIAVRYLTVIV